VGDVHRRERRREAVGEGHVVEPDHRHVGRAAQARLGERGVGAQGEQVVRRDDAGRPRAGEEPAGCLLAGGDREGVRLRDQAALDGKSGVLHRLDEPSVAQEPGRRRLRAGDVGDAGVAELGQVPHRHRRPAAVVGDDREDPAALDRPVHEHDRESRRDRVGHHRMAALGRRDDEAVDLARDQRLEPLALAGRVAVCRGHQGRVARGVEDAFDAADDGREERILEVGDEHPDAERAPGLQPARDRVQRVAELACDLLDALGGGRVHERARARVEHPRHGARMDSGGSGDVAHGDLRLRHGRSL